MNQDSSSRILRWTIRTFEWPLASTCSSSLLQIPRRQTQSGSVQQCQGTSPSSQRCRESARYPFLTQRNCITVLSRVRTVGSSTLARYTGVLVMPHPHVLETCYTSCHVARLCQRVDLPDYKVCNPSYSHECGMFWQRGAGIRRERIRQRRFVR